VNTCFEQFLHGDGCQCPSLCGLHPGFSFCCPDLSRIRGRFDETVIGSR
jgi:hypothetical protein